MRGHHDGLRVALHAQASYSTAGYVAGSEITTTLLSAAFQRLPSVETVRIFSPFQSAGLDAEQWDLVLIEGWFPSMRTWIHEVRRLANDHPIVLFYSLDPGMPGLSVLSRSDVDGFLSNSARLVKTLTELAPTKEVLLAAPRGPTFPPTMFDRNLDTRLEIRETRMCVERPGRRELPCLWADRDEAYVPPSLTPLQRINALDERTVCGAMDHEEEEPGVDPSRGVRDGTADE